MPSRTITFRFSDEVINIIEAQARAMGSNRTAVVLNALTECYGVAVPAPSKSAIEQLQQQVHHLEKQITELSEQLAKIQLQETFFNSHTPTAHASTSYPPKVMSASTSSLEAPELAQTDNEGFSVADESILQIKTAEYLVPETQPELLTQLNYQTGLLDQVLSASPDMIFILDRRQRFTYINSVSRRLLKVERHYILGKTFQEIEPFAWGEAFVSQCEKVFASGQTVYGELNIPVPHENRAYEYRLSPIYGVGGGIDAVICVARDVTERKQAELAIQEAEKKHHNVFESANDSIFISDLATQRILNANQKAARRLGYTRQELLQLTIDDVTMPFTANRREEILQELQATGSAMFEHQQRHKNGKIIPVEFSCHMIEYDGKLAVQSFVQDITKREKAEEQLRLMEMALARATNAIATGMCHEVWESPEIRYSFCEDEE
jgi:PAS domain S-box-containing protein